MKILRIGEISDILATSENPAYPVENLLNGSPKRAWRVADETITYAEVSFYTQSGSDSICLIGLYADRATLVLSSVNGADWVDTTWGNVDWQDVISGVEYSYDLREERGATDVWITTPVYDTELNATLKLYKDTTTPDAISCGVIKVGTAMQLGCVERGLREGAIDYSIEKELSVGAFWYHLRDIVRTFSGTMFFKEKELAWDFFRHIVREHGKTPTVFKLAEAYNETIVYGRFTTLPGISHEFISEVRVNFEITEEL